MASKTPQTREEFFDYRIDETNNKIDDANKKLERIESKLDDTYATKDYTDAKVKTVEDRVNSLEDDRKWIIRLVLGFLVLGVLGAVIVFK